MVAGLSGGIFFTPNNELGIILLIAFGVAAVATAVSKRWWIGLIAVVLLGAAVVAFSGILVTN